MTDFELWGGAVLLFLPTYKTSKIHLRNFDLDIQRIFTVALFSMYIQNNSNTHLLTMISLKEKEGEQ